MQAVGSVVAIGIAIWLAYWSAKDQRRQAESAVRSFEAALHFWLKKEIALCEQHDGAQLAFHTEVLRDMIEVTKSIRIDLLAVGRMYRFLQLRAIAVEAVTAANTIAGQQEGWSHWGNEFVKLEDRLNKHILKA